MAISVLDPIGPAVRRTKLVLFSPFDFGKWLCLGFCAFLAALATGGSGGGGGTGGNSGGGGNMDFEPMVAWLRENAVVVASVVAAVILLLFLLGCLLTWLGSRGTFMLLDGVIENRGAVVEPWHEYRREGNSLFKFRFFFGAVMFLLVLLLLAACAMLAWQDIQQNQFAESAILAIVGLVVGVIPIAIVGGVVGMFLNDLVAPAMYLRRILVMDAWSVCYRELLQGRFGTFVLYVLAKMVIAVVVAAAGTAILLCTCCIAAVPYVGSVFMLPLTVFVRSYSLCFLEQFGPDWLVFEDAEPQTPALNPTGL